jgi:hypothetical protein
MISLPATHNKRSMKATQRSRSSISDLENLRASRRGQSLFSLERLIIIGLSIMLAGTVVAWSQEHSRPIPAFVVDPAGTVQLAKPVDPWLRTPEEVKGFAEKIYRGLYGWSIESPSGSPETDVKLASIGLAPPLAKAILDEFAAQKVYQNIKNNQIRTDISFRPLQIVKSESPYEVIMIGDRRIFSKNGSIIGAGFAKKLTIEVTQRTSPFNPSGLVITKIEDIDPVSLK